MAGTVAGAFLYSSFAFAYNAITTGFEEILGRLAAGLGRLQLICAFFFGLFLASTLTLELSRRCRLIVTDMVVTTTGL